jgi:hypothetical protein
LKKAKTGLGEAQLDRAGSEKRKRREKYASGGKREKSRPHREGEKKKTSVH